MIARTLGAHVALVRADQSVRTRATLVLERHEGPEVDPVARDLARPHDHELVEALAQELDPAVDLARSRFLP
jgi:hypothetical protein